MSKIESAAEGLMQDYCDAVAAKDVAALMRLYAPQARIFDAWGVWSYEGSAPWRVAVEGWLSSLGDERATVAFEDTQITGQEGLAVVTSIVTYAGYTAQGEPLRSMQNRLSWVVDLTGPEPRIVHEHTSAPIGFEDTKAILKRGQDN